MARKKKKPDVSDIIASVTKTDPLVEDADLLASDEAKEVLPQLPTPEVNEEIILPKSSDGVSRRYLGRHPITKEAVYK